jgi:hypothetical protein
MASFGRLNKSAGSQLPALSWCLPLLESGAGPERDATLSPFPKVQPALVAAASLLAEGLS